MAKRKHTYERAARKRKALERAKAALRPPRPKKSDAEPAAEPAAEPESAAAEAASGQAAEPSQASDT